MRLICAAKLLFPQIGFVEALKCARFIGWFLLYLRLSIKNGVFMQQVALLLKDINLLNQKIQDREKNDDEINIFALMFRQSDEVNLHSRFLSFMLDPHGRHKKGDSFLRLFLDQIGVGFSYDIAHIETYPNERNNHKEHKEIDILLIDRVAKQALILENKIYAPDSNHTDEGQLARYYRVIQEEGIPSEQISVIYLSLDRPGPSDESVSRYGKIDEELKNKVINIHYGVEILNWLSMCVEICFDNSKLRDMILQYLKLVKTMTHSTTSEDDKKRLMEIVGRNAETLSSAKLLADNFKHLYWYSLFEFWDLLSKTLISLGYSINVGGNIDNDEISDLVHRGKRKDFCLRLTAPCGANVEVRCDYGEELYIRVTGNRSRSDDNCGAIPEKQKVTFSNDEALRLSDFSSDTTFNLISREIRQDYVSKIAATIQSMVKSFVD